MLEVVMDIGDFLFIISPHENFFDIIDYILTFGLAGFFNGLTDLYIDRATSYVIFSADRGSLQAGLFDPAQMCIQFQDSQVHHADRFSGDYLYRCVFPGIRVDGCQG